MSGSKNSLRVVYYLCLFLLGNVLTSLFLRDFVGELVSVFGVLIVLISLFRLSHLGYGLKGGCICFFIVYTLSLLKIPGDMLMYLTIERPSEEYIRNLFAYAVELKKWQGVEHIIVGVGFVLKITGWLLWMRSKVFVGVKKLFYFLIADPAIGLIFLCLSSFANDFNFNLYFINYIAHILAVAALGIMVYRLRREITVLRETRKNYAFALCFLIGHCYLPFLFVGYATFQVYFWIACVFLLYGIRFWSTENGRMNVFYGWLCAGGLALGISGYRLYGTFVAVSPQFFYLVFLVWGMLAACFGLLAGEGENKRLFWGLCGLSVLLIPLTLLYSRGIAFFAVAFVWAWVWLPLWVLCLVKLVKHYFQFSDRRGHEFVGNITEDK